MDRKQTAQRIARQFLAGNSGWERIVLGSLRVVEEQFDTYVKKITGGQRSAANLSLVRGKIESTVWLDLPESGGEKEARDLAKAILGPALSKLEPHKMVKGMWVAHGYDSAEFLLK